MDFRLQRESIPGLVHQRASALPYELAGLQVHVERIGKDGKGHNWEIKNENYHCLEIQGVTNF